MKNIARHITVLLPVLILLTVFSSFTGGKPKKYPFEKWTKEELEKANSAKDANYLSAEEKQVIFYTNLARINPKLFGLTYAQKYIDSTGLRGKYCSSLLNALKNTDAVGALQADSLLTQTAAEHAEATGKRGATGHSGKNKRFNEVKGQFNLWGENCSYGKELALDIVMQLLIDNDVPDLGHRKNILNKNFTHIGTAIRDHKKYKWNCVQNFGGKISQ